MRFSMPGMPIRTILSAAFIEDGSHLFEAVHLQPGCFIDQNERGWVGDSLLSRLILFEGLEVGWVNRRSVARVAFRSDVASARPRTLSISGTTEDHFRFARNSGVTRLMLSLYGAQ
jgi:hypothetical protein